MNFDALKRRVDRSEALVDGRVKQVKHDYAEMHRHWTEGLTAPRIVLTGLIAGFITGKAQPERALMTLGKVGKAGANPNVLRTITAITGLITSVQTAFAAMVAAKSADVAADAASDASDQADTAADAADVAVDGATAAVDAAPAVDDTDAPATALPPSDRPRRVDRAWDAAPSPAEAATDVSER